MPLPTIGDDINYSINVDANYALTRTFSTRVIKRAMELLHPKGLGFITIHNLRVEKDVSRRTYWFECIFTLQPISYGQHEERRVIAFVMKAALFEKTTDIHYCLDQLAYHLAYHIESDYKEMYFPQPMKPSARKEKEEKVRVIRFMKRP